MNPEVGHEEMSNLNFPHAIAQALWSGKLFHIDLNGQNGPKFDQDMRFGAGNLRQAFWLVDLLETAGYAGPKHFDYKPSRTEDIDGVWASAKGCMDNYLMLRERTRAFRADPRVADALAASRVGELSEPTRGHGESLADLRAESFDPDAWAERGYAFDALDQLAMGAPHGRRLRAAVTSRTGRSSQGCRRAALRRRREHAGSSLPDRGRRRGEVYFLTFSNPRRGRPPLALVVRSTGPGTGNLAGVEPGQATVLSVNRCRAAWRETPRATAIRFHDRSCARATPTASRRRASSSRTASEAAATRRRSSVDSTTAVSGSRLSASAPKRLAASSICSSVWCTAGSVSVTAIRRTCSAGAWRG